MIKASLRRTLGGPRDNLMAAFEDVTGMPPVVTVSLFHPSLSYPAPEHSRVPLVGARALLCRAESVGGACPSFLTHLCNTNVSSRVTRMKLDALWLLRYRIFP